MAIFKKIILGVTSKLDYFWGSFLKTTVLGVLMVSFKCKLYENYRTINLHIEHVETKDFNFILSRIYFRLTIDELLQIHHQCPSYKARLPFVQKGMLKV